jgi:hypothetical protein
MGERVDTPLAKVVFDLADTLWRHDRRIREIVGAAG